MKHGLVCTLILLIVGWRLPVAGQRAASTSVWDGIFTKEQATRGETEYREACASCHGEKLDGSGQNPPLVGSDFTSNWNGMSVGDLFDKIQVSMPADRPGRLTAEQNADILAYILSINKFPAGDRELPPGSAALKSVRFEADRPAE